MNRTNNNLAALYKYIEEHGDPKGILWTKNVMQQAALLHKKVMDFNELLESQKGSPDMIVQSRIGNLQTSLGTFTPGNTYEVPTISGKLKERKIPDVAPEERLLLCLNGIVHISQAFSAEGEIDDDASQALLYELKPKAVTTHEDKSTCTISNTDTDSPPWEFWKESWRTGAWHNSRNDIWNTKLVNARWQKAPPLLSEEANKLDKWATIWRTLSDRLKNFITKYESALKDVDQVVCFALGSLDVGYPRSFVQHLAANTVAEALNELRRTKGISTPVSTFAQDPAYCDNCIDILQSELNIKATKSHEAFSKVNKNTFVITFAPTGPICPIIADLTREFDGPAAMLCDEIIDDYMEPQHEKGTWIDNYPTSTLVDYKKKCFSEYFGDDKELLGMSHEEFRNKYPLVPSRKDIPEGVDKQTEKEWKDGYANEVRRCFGNSYLYVRK
ncbi:hypothetical protein N0V90_003853 [Kalmusia sp. IMI 367209]|nr:hypothetical protein N0V90_003853 [Kalmusia sp. IMI 367209]